MRAWFYINLCALVVSLMLGLVVAAIINGIAIAIWLSVLPFRSCPSRPQSSPRGDG